MPPVKIIDNGPDAKRMVIVVLGDGYAQNDQEKYRKDVQKLVVDGVLAHDVYGDNRRAFNVYRVDLVSAESGVSTPTDSKDTALKLVYTGVWESCWINPSSQTTALIKAAAKGIDYNFVLLMCNESGFGGCQSGKRMYITSGINWDLVAHEYGHAVAGLFDEYVEKQTAYTGPVINVGNCSTVLDRSKVVWRSLIAASTPIPTKPGVGVGAATVGMFEGCNTFKKKIYRAADNCLMRESDQSPVPSFCPVCRPLMTTALAPFLPAPADADSEAGHDPATGGESEVMGEVNENEGGSYLFVELRITPDGNFEVLSAEELPGTPVPQKVPISRFAYEVVTGGDTLSVETLAEDPFVSRSFPPPGSGLGPGYRRAERAVLPVRIPVSAAGLADDQTIGLRLYAVEPGADATALDADTLPALNAGGQLELRAEIPAERLGPAILEKLGES